MPLVIDVPADPRKAVTLDAPIHGLEVQLGSVVARDPGGQEREGNAGETIDCDRLRTPVTLIATGSPCRVSVVHDPEALAFEARRRRDVA
jgi:hypothetical protein